MSKRPICFLLSLFRNPYFQQRSVESVKYGNRVPARWEGKRFVASELFQCRRMSQSGLFGNKTLGAGPMHGYRIASKIHQLSADVLRVEEGSLYPALYRMEQKGLIESEWD
jgi:Transcriptional regulator PadR-like family